MTTPTSVVGFEYKKQVFVPSSSAEEGLTIQTVTEVFFPAYKIIINSAGALFSADRAQNLEEVGLLGDIKNCPIEEVRWSGDTVKKIVQIVQKRLTREAMQTELDELDKEIEAELTACDIDLVRMGFKAQYRSASR